MSGVQLTLAGPAKPYFRITPVEPRLVDVRMFGPELGSAAHD